MKISVTLALLLLTQAVAAELTQHDVVVDDVAIHYAETGTGPVLLLLHGLWGGNNEWTPIIGALGENHRVIAMDLPGFHRSEKLEERYSNALLSGYLAEFIQRLALENVTLVGHAMGANLATYTAYHHPDDIRALILIDGAGYRNPDRDLSQPPSEAMTGFIRIATGDTLETTRGLLQRRVNDPSQVNDEWIEDAHSMWQISATAIADMLREGGDLTEAQMRQIGIPTLVVWGVEDKVFSPDNAVRLENDLANAETVMIDGSGHLPQIEKTDDFLRAVLPFLSKLRAEQ